MNASDIAHIPLIRPIRTTPSSTFHITKWYSIELCFLFNVDSNLELLLTTLLFSFKILDSPSTILNLNLNDMICSTYFFNAITSLPKVLDSTVACLLLYHIIRSRLTNIIYPVWDRLVLLSDAWYASTNAVTSTNLPLAFGASVGSSSLAPLYWSQNSSAFLPVNYVEYITAGLGSKYSIIFGFLFKKAKMCNICCKWPSPGAAWYEESTDTSCSMSTIPLSISHINYPIISWYIVIPYDSNSVLASSLGM